MTSFFDKENSQRSTHYVIDARYVKETFTFHKLNVQFHPALKYIMSYSFLTIRRAYTDQFYKRSQKRFVVVQVDMWGGPLDETAIPGPLISACYNI